MACAPPCDTVVAVDGLQVFAAVTSWYTQASEAGVSKNPPGVLAALMGSPPGVLAALMGSPPSGMNMRTNVRARLPTSSGRAILDSGTMIVPPPVWRQFLHLRQ